MAKCTFGNGTDLFVYNLTIFENQKSRDRANTELCRNFRIGIHIYFADYGFAGMPPPIPEALQLYLHMIEGLDLKWSVGVVNHDVMETPLAQMALERGGSFRVGLEDWGKGPSNLEQLERAKEMISKVGRPIVSGADAIEYLDIPFPATQPKA